MSSVPPVFTTSENIPAIIAVAREAGAALAPKSHLATIDGVPCRVADLANGAVIITALQLPEKNLPAPRRKRAHSSFYEPASFAEYVNRHKIPDATILFGTCTETSATFSAVIDGHGTGPAGAPAFGEHTAALALSITPEWKRWMDKNARFMPQHEFAEHIEDNLLDIVEPAAADLLEIAQGLAGMKNTQFKSGRNLQDGSIKFQLIETITIGGSTNETRRDAAFSVPAKFNLQLVPFIGAAGVEIEARLRFRIGSDGSVSFAYLLNRPYKVIETAFTVTCEQIEKETGIKVLLGGGRILAA
jgi:uncharacterized protein YfdQ (DUF2303 family)